MVSLSTKLAKKKKPIVQVETKVIVCSNGMLDDIKGEDNNGIITSDR